MNTTSDRRRESTPLLDALLASPVGEHRNHNKNSPAARLTLGEALDRIQHGYYAQVLQPVQSARERHGYPSRQYSEAKDLLPVFTFTGICHREERNSHVVESSGVLILDVDRLPTTEVAVAFRDAALQISHTVAAFLSPSKRGIKVVVALDGTPPPGNAEVHKNAFKAAQFFYETALSIKVDGSGSDPTHFCYVAHDPDMGWGQGVPFPWQVSDTAADADTSQDHFGRNRRPGPRENVDDHAAIEEALRHIPCPRETGNGDGYNAWLDLIIMQKAVGRTPEQIAQWCEGGKAEGCGEIDQLLSRWDGLRDDAPGLACARIKKVAREQGWRGPQNAGFSGHGGNGHRGNGRNGQGFRSGFHFSGPRQDPPDTILPKVEPQRTYPVPSEMAWHHSGILETSGASAAAAGTGMIASMALLASEDYDVAWPPGGSTATPLGLFHLHLSDSGGRKSSVWTRSFAGHVEADRRIAALWQDAKEQWNEWEALSKDDKRKAISQKPELPTKYIPKAVRRDTTPRLSSSATVVDAEPKA